MGGANALLPRLSTTCTPPNSFLKVFRRVSDLPVTNVADQKHFQTGFLENEFGGVQVVDNLGNMPECKQLAIRSVGPRKWVGERGTVLYGEHRTSTKFRERGTNGNFSKVIPD